MSPVATVATLCLALGATSCYHAPDPAFLDTLREIEMNTPRFVQCEVEASLDSDEGSGEFQGALLIEHGERPRVRIKLFPDLGSAALDLVATPRRIEAEFPLRDESFRTELPPEEDLDASVPFLFGVTLWEYFAGIDPGRVVGVRDHELGTRVKLTPHSTGVVCRAIVDGQGQARVREFRYGWFVRWKLTVEEEGFLLSAPGLEFRLRYVDCAEVADLPDAFFELDPREG